jgi:RNA exonuclease 4
LPPTHPGRAKRLERQKKERQEKEQQEKTSSKKKKPSQPVVSLPVSDSKEPTKVLALDCEMVGVGIGGFDSALARVTILNSYG